MIKQHSEFKIPDNIDGPIWRYISIQKLQSLLNTKSLYFSRADLFEDGNEGSVPQPTIDRRPVFYSEATEHFINEGVVEMAKTWAKCTYINCWHNAKNESHAMWELYLGNTPGVAIKTTISKLKNAIQDSNRTFCLGFVNYLDFDTDYAPEGNAFAPFFIKRDIYQHESEFRILTYELEDIGAVANGSKTPSDGIFIPVSLDMLITSVVISPKSNNADKKKIEIMLKAGKLVDHLSPSTINRTPHF